MTQISEEKMQLAYGLLFKIIEFTQQYDKLFQTLTIQEKHLAGGIVFRVRNPWTDLQMVGIMANREIAREMIDTLAFFYQNPQAFAGKEPNLIVPDKDKSEN